MELKCKNCGIKFKRNLRSRDKNIKNFFCSSYCALKFNGKKYWGLKGNKNPNWKGNPSKKRFRKKGTISAYGKTHRAIASGKLKKQPCKICGSKKTEAHHNDYSKPLEVIWLCKSHHNLADRGKIKIKK